MASPQPEESILVIDDAPDTLEVIERNLSLEGFRVFTTADPEEAMRLLDDEPVDLVVTDLRMPGASGMDIVRHVQENFPDTEIMMITGYATIEGAVEAIKTGAQEYLAKPFTDTELLAAVHRALEKLRMRRKGNGGGNAAPLAGLLGASPAMEKVFRRIRKTAATPATVLITGESGTGKELVARAIHYASPRSRGPFVPVNCAGIPEGLLESELFGHVKGAFTGATESRAGFFQTADGGSLFLDEIGEISLSTQVKLLRVLQDKQVCMVGDSRSREVDVRILAATNKNLESLVAKGLFREDLYFRIHVLAIEVPPLRERGDDILRMVRHFTEKYCQEMGREPLDYEDRALEALQAYEWPGNVRELENVVQRLVVLCEGETVAPSDLPSLLRFSPPRSTGAQRTLADVERDHIRRVLASVDNNKTRAAEILGIDRKTLREKLKRLS